jgi:hypothetical protein
MSDAPCSHPDEALVLWSEDCSVSCKLCTFRLQLDPKLFSNAVAMRALRMPLGVLNREPPRSSWLR